MSPSAPIEVDADGVRLAQAVDNVISNAIKFTPEGGSVEVALAQDGDRVSLTVTDTGMGMTAADIERLFEPFFRTDSAGEIQGTGLGLPIVKAIIEAHDGLISVAASRTSARHSSSRCPSQSRSNVKPCPVCTRRPCRSDPQLASAASTWSACVAGFTSCITVLTVPSASITKVERLTPM